MSIIDLALRYAIISAACQLACAWAHTFHAPWPLADAFELAPTAEEQLFKSLGVRFDCSCPRPGWLPGTSAVGLCQGDGDNGMSRACQGGMPRGRG